MVSMLGNPINGVVTGFNIAFGTVVLTLIPLEFPIFQSVSPIQSVLDSLQNAAEHCRYIVMYIDLDS